MRGRESAMGRAEARRVPHWAHRGPWGCPCSLHTRWSRNAGPRAVGPGGSPGVAPLPVLAARVAVAARRAGP